MTNTPSSEPCGPVPWWRGRPAIVVAATLAGVLIAGVLIANSGDDSSPNAEPTSTSRDVSNASTTSAPPTSNGASDAGSTTTPAPTTKPTPTGPAATTTTARKSTATTIAPESLWPAYSAGWKAACRELWNHSPNGQMYDPDDTATPHPYADCLEDLDPLFQSPDAQSPAAATAAGRADALQFASLMSVTGLLCWLGAGSENFAGCIDPSQPTVVVPPPAE